MRKVVNRKNFRSRKLWKREVESALVCVRDFCKENPIIFVGLILFAGFLFLVQEKRTINISLSSDSLTAQVLDADRGVSNADTSPISGLPCADHGRRPVAAMLASDPVTRPLSGLKDADLVFEMQVVQDSITRLMAVYVCGNPKEVGSIRSARHSFIPLAMGIDAVYVHWGGSHFALDKLDAGIMDNVDALKNPFDAFYRKSGIEAPHNGFSSMVRLLNSASKIGYRLENKFEGYPHTNDSPYAKTSEDGRRLSSGKQIIKISYAYPYNVEYRYDPAGNFYSRWRGGTPEIDKLSGQQIEAKNVVVMRAASEGLEGQYNNVEVEGGGKATVYRNGEAISGRWEKNKKNQKSKLYFYDKNGEEIKFVPGQIWVEIIEPEKSVEWTND